MRTRLVHVYTQPDRPLALAVGSASLMTGNREQAQNLRIRPTITKTSSITAPTGALFAVYASFFVEMTSGGTVIPTALVPNRSVGEDSVASSVSYEVSSNGRVTLDEVVPH